MNEIWLAVSTKGEVYVRIPGRRDRAIEGAEVSIPVEADVGEHEIRRKSSMKFPAAIFDEVRGSSSCRVTSYGWSEINPWSRGTVPHGCPSL